MSGVTSVSTTEELLEKKSIAGFLAAHRKVLTAVIIAVVAGTGIFLGISAFLSAQENRRLIELETLIERYTALESALETDGEDASIVHVSGTEAVTIDVPTMLSSLEAFATSASGYAAAKAWSLIGNIYAKQKKWPDAEKAFLEQAASGAKTHLYGPGLYNAGVAAQEAGNIGAAIEHYTKSLSAQNAVFAPHAQFSIGYLKEKDGDQEAARAAYRAVIENYADSADAKWRNLAQSRLIALE